MKQSDLEDKVNQPLDTGIKKTGKPYQAVKSGLESVLRGYERLHSAYPLITNYLSTAVGTVGGDAIAKQFTDNPDITLRDVAFTGMAAFAYSYLAPKMIEWSTAITNKISKFWERLKKNKTAHTIVNSCVLTAMYFPVNMVYWNYLTIKNQAPITWENNETGAITLGIATTAYLVADYVAIKRFSQPKTKKYLRPFYSAVEIVWNTIFAGGNYLAKMK